MVPLGIGSAAAVSVGREIGFGDREAAKRVGWTALALSAGFEILAALAFVFLPKEIAAAYTADPAVVSLAVTLLGIAAFFQLFDGLQTVASGALRGAGDTKTPMVWNLASYYLITLPVSYWICFQLGWGVTGLWIGLCVGLILIAGGLVYRWSKIS
jgi:MATE family multidrug resistance protein